MMSISTMMFRNARFLPGARLAARMHHSPTMRMSMGIGAACVGIGIGVASNTIHSEGTGQLGTSSDTPKARVSSPSKEQSLPSPLGPPPPKSMVSWPALSFGTVTGICAGVFVKKGAKAIAFVLGGVFVLLQYLSSRSYIRIDWGRIERRFQEWAGTDSRGVLSLEKLMDFLAADFQPRAAFCAGLALGLRLG